MSGWVTMMLRLSLTMCQGATRRVLGPGWHFSLSTGLPGPNPVSCLPFLQLDTWTRSLPDGLFGICPYPLLLELHQIVFPAQSGALTLALRSRFYGSLAPSMQHFPSIVHLTAGYYKTEVSTPKTYFKVAPNILT